MKKNKIVFIIILIAITIGIVGTVNVCINQSQSSQEKIKAYNHNPVNSLDNVFIKDNIRYLPFILDNSEQVITKDRIINEFRNAGLTVKSISEDGIITTGTQITVNENANSYTVVIYGDADGDGYVDVFDAQRIVEHFINGGASTLTGAYAIAANVDNDDDEIDVFDAQQIVAFFIGAETRLVLNEPLSLKEIDQTPPQIINTVTYLTLNYGDPYVDAQVTAVDNFDGDITYKISKEIVFTGYGTTTTETSIDTSKVGTYDITYTVYDSCGNYATSTRRIVINDVIDNITMESYPTKTTYQYGEATQLDLANATIRITTKGGTGNGVISVTQDMLSEYDLTTSGLKTIAVNYQGKQAYFDVRVLNKVSELIISNDNMLNATIAQVDDEKIYKTYSNVAQGFVLGTISKNQGEYVTDLKVSDLMLEKQVANETSDIDALNVELDVINENIVIKGNVTKVGEYVITVYIASYNDDNNNRIEKQIKLNVEKSEEIGSIIIDEITDEVIKGRPVTTSISFKNVNGEQIEVTSKQLNVLSQLPEEVIISKLDGNGDIISETEDLKIVEALEINTTFDVIPQEYKDGITVELEALQNGVETVGTGVKTSITFKLNNASVLSDVIFASSNEEKAKEQLNLYLDGPFKDEVIIADNGNIYTVIPVIFKDQYGKKLNLTKEDITADIVTSQELRISIPLVQAYKTNDNGETELVNDFSGISYILYNQDGKDTATNGGYVTKIGFSILLNEIETKVNLSSIKGDISFNCKGGKIIKLPMVVNYKELTSAKVNISNATITKNESTGNYETGLNKVFILGTIDVNYGEGPLTKEIVSAIVEAINGEANGINVYSDVDKQTGNILLKGYATKEGIYKVTPKVEGATITDIFRIEAKDVPVDIDIGEDENNNITLPNGKYNNEFVVTGSSTNIIDIIADDIEITQTIDDVAGNYVNIALEDSEGFEIEEDQGSREVSSIKFSMTSAQLVNWSNLGEKEIKLKIKVCGVYEEIFTLVITKAQVTD